MKCKSLASISPFLIDGDCRGTTILHPSHGAMPQIGSMWVNKSIVRKASPAVFQRRSINKDVR